MLKVVITKKKAYFISKFCFFQTFLFIQKMHVFNIGFVLFDGTYQMKNIYLVCI